MKKKIPKEIFAAIASVLLMGSGLAAQTPSKKTPMPEVRGWKIAEKPQSYVTETLFEYIDGAAESYLSYDFRELLVIQYQGPGKANLSLEAYDMGNTRNAFGIYSAERSPESDPISIGLAGYQEEESLNFIIGGYYVKLICFDGGDKTPAVLDSFAKAFAENAGAKGTLPPLIQAFPKEGLVARSEKFILRNFLGYPFLHDGYIASYKTGDVEFDAFLIEGSSEDEAVRMLKQYVDKLAANGAAVKPSAAEIHVRDRYALNVFLGRAGRIVCGVMRIKDGSESTGGKYLASLLKTAGK